MAPRDSPDAYFDPLRPPGCPPRPPWTPKHPLLPHWTLKVTCSSLKIIIDKAADDDQWKLSNWVLNVWVSCAFGNVSVVVGIGKIFVKIKEAARARWRTGSAKLSAHLRHSSPAKSSSRLFFLCKIWQMQKWDQNFDMVAQLEIIKRKI